MKHFLILPFALTAGGAATIGTVNYSSKHIQNSQISNSIEDAEISDKNISELSNIEKLKNDQKIPDLVPENISNFEQPTSTISTYYSSVINVLDEKSNITTFTNSITHKQSVLQNILANQVKFSNSSDTYTKIKNHFNTNPPVKSEWEMVIDGNKCKIQEVSTSSTSTTPPDSCSYDWNIILIDVTDKIPALLSKSSTVTPSPSSLLAQYNGLTIK